MAEKPGHERPKLSRNQRRALDALLACPSVAAAARSCGLCDRTLWRYLGDNQFKAQLRARQDKMTAATAAGLSGLTGDAVGALREALARLADDATADLSDFIEVDDKGGWRLNLVKAEEAGKLHLVKRLWATKDGDDRLELHDPQAAAARLARVALDVLGEKRRQVELDDLAQRVGQLEQTIGKRGKR